MNGNIVVKPIPDVDVDRRVNEECGFPFLNQLYRQFIRDDAFLCESGDINRFVPQKGKRYFLIEHDGQTEALFGVIFSSGQSNVQISFSRIIDPEICRYKDRNLQNDAPRLEIRWPDRIAEGWMYLDSMVQELFKGGTRIITSKALSKGGKFAFRSFRNKCGQKYKIKIDSAGSSLLVQPLKQSGE